MRACSKWVRTSAGEPDGHPPDDAAARGPESGGAYLRVLGPADGWQGTRCLPDGSTHPGQRCQPQDPPRTNLPRFSPAPMSSAIRSGETRLPSTPSRGQTSERWSGSRRGLLLLWLAAAATAAAAVAAASAVVMCCACCTALLASIDGPRSCGWLAFALLSR